jgi:hypothetical protein
MASRLAPDGILAMNVETVGWEDPLLGGLAASLAPHFERLLALPTVEPPDALGNVVLVGSRRPLEFDEVARLPRPFDFLDRPHQHWWSVQITHAWDNRFEPGIRGKPFTDDRNPLDIRAERVNRLARRDLHRYFARFGWDW